MWFVYVILCGDGSFYTGYSDDVERRFALHQSGKGGRYTRAKKVVKVIYQEQLSSKSEALKKEAEIKSWSRAEKIRKLNLVYS
jgi:putative endonuclease